MISFRRLFPCRRMVPSLAPAGVGGLVPGGGQSVHSQKKQGSIGPTTSDRTADRVIEPWASGSVVGGGPETEDHNGLHPHSY